MEAWLKAAIDYVPRWLDYQLRVTRQPGCGVAIARQGKVILERGFGTAGGADRPALSPRHRFRVASHSKSFTAAGVLKLREQGRLRLDDRAGQYVKGLHRAVAEATLEQLLSHGAGVTRDGDDAGQWEDRLAFADERQLRAALTEAPVLDAGTQLKYSNHGFGLLGLVIEAVTSEPYAEWMRREIVAPSGLQHTEPDGPAPPGTPVVLGHTRALPGVERLLVAGDNPTAALAPATGFVSTPSDLARFFASLDPAAKRSVLSVASRRELVRRRWDVEHSPLRRQYGLGLLLNDIDGWKTFGHRGAFQSCLSRTCALLGRGLVVSVATNAVDGPAEPWATGVVHILQSFERYGAPTARTRPWQGRWWNHWATMDLVAHKDRIRIAQPALASPFHCATELTVTGRDNAKITLASGTTGSPGESARLVRNARGSIREVWIGGTRYVTERRLSNELRRRYRPSGLTE